MSISSTLKYIILVCAAGIASACTVQTSFGVAPVSNDVSQAASYNTEVDVLFIVDNSDSMAPRQNAIAAQAHSMIAALGATGLDYHIAVTSTDMNPGAEQGAFVAQAGTPKVLTAAVANVGSMLSGRFLLGTNGSRVEQGLGAMKAALSSTKLAGVNAGFLRQHALLSVVIISDEDDQSPSTDYEAWLNQLKPKLASGESSWVFNYIGVMATDPDCTSAEWQYFSPGVKYMALAQKSGGVLESICHSDMSSTAKNMHARLMEIITEYFLEGVPKVSTILVQVDGVVVPQSETNGWTYNSTHNSIIFHGSAVPRPNAKVMVGFDPEKLK